jgi:hypothetical protein
MTWPIAPDRSGGLEPIEFSAQSATYSRRVIFFGKPVHTRYPDAGQVFPDHRRDGTL